VVLISQIAGVGLAAVCLVVLVRRFAPAPRRSFVAVVAIPVVVAALLGLPALRSAIDELGDARDRNLTLTSAQAQVQAGAGYGARTDFIDWVRSRMRPGDTYHLPPIPGAQPPAIRSAIHQWSTFQLTPFLLVERPRDADWLILYGRAPGAGYPAALFGPPRRFDAGLYLLKRRDAG
jgi:hypothetical protein